MYREKTINNNHTPRIINITQRVLLPGNRGVTAGAPGTEASGGDQYGVSSISGVPDMSPGSRRFAILSMGDAFRIRQAHGESVSPVATAENSLYIYLH